MRAAPTLLCCWALTAAVACASPEPRRSDSPIAEPPVVQEVVAPGGPTMAAPVAEPALAASSPVSASAPPASTQPAPAAEASSSPSETAEPTDLVIQDLRPGHGKPVTKGDRVTVHYVGRLPGGLVFDSTRDRGKPATFDIGKGQLIPGWERGMLGMKPGGRRRLVIPSSLGYGAKGAAGGKIPPNSTLIFEIELVSVP